MIGCLNQKVLKHSIIKSLCYKGIPYECKGLRALLWKIALGYLPMKTERWKKHLVK